MTRRLVALPPSVAAALPRGSSAAARRLSADYRAGTPAALSTDADLRAYATVRFPATYAAATAALEECAAAAPQWTPATALDVGSGLGATAAAARGLWPDLAHTCLERDPRALAAGRAVIDARWVQAEVADLPEGSWDLVTAGYLLNELPDPVAVAAALWQRTAELLVLVEPGRPQAYEVLMEIRAALVAEGAHVLAPCPHDGPCPLRGRDWCHLGQRLVRSAAHVAAKDADRPYEDEPYSYVALARTLVSPGLPRVIRRPAQRKGLVLLDLCTTDGVGRRPVPKSAGEVYRRAKDVLWGQTFS